MRSENILVRCPGFEDFPAIAEIKVRGWQAAYDQIVDETYLRKLSEEQICDKMRENKKKDRFLVAEVSGEIAGFCRYRLHEETAGPEKRRGEISELYVKPDRKRMGIGGLLFQYVMDDMKESGCGSVELGCFSENYPALAFYRKMNGVLVGKEAIELDGRKYAVDQYRFVL